MKKYIDVDVLKDAINYEIDKEGGYPMELIVALDIIDELPSVLAKDLSVCKPVKIRYRGNSKTISGYLDETRNLVFTQAITAELLKSAGFSVEIEEEQLRNGGSEK